MKRTILAVALIVAAFGSQANAASPELLSSYKLLNEQCRGGNPDKPSTLNACDKRQNVSQALKNAGYCFGKSGQYGGEMWWHRCAAASLRD